MEKPDVFFYTCWQVCIDLNGSKWGLIYGLMINYRSKWAIFQHTMIDYEEIRWGLNQLGTVGESIFNLVWSQLVLHQGQCWGNIGIMFSFYGEMERSLYIVCLCLFHICLPMLEPPWYNVVPEMYPVYSFATFGFQKAIRNMFSNPPKLQGPQWLSRNQSSLLLMINIDHKAFK